MRIMGSARLERILQRHRDAEVVEPIHGRHSVIRRDQLVTTQRDAPTVHELLGRWVEQREEGLGVTRFHLRAKAKVDTCELAAEVGGRSRHRTLAVAPNHLLGGQPLWWGGPSDVPHPAPPITRPETDTPGRPVTAAILDTGLSRHPWFEGRQWFANQPDGAVEDHTADADSHVDYELDGFAGHGTFVSGVFLQQAPGARLRVLPVLGSDGVCDEFHLVQAFAELREWSRASGHEIDIINLSLGCYTYDDRPSPVIDQAITSFGRRTAVVACAGNEASDRPFWPAALKSVISVAALDANGNDRAWFSNYGWWVDACAVGEDVESSFLRFDGPVPEVDGIDPDEFHDYASWSGTSFAAPHVAGAIARRSAQEDIPAALATDRVLDPATQLTRPDLGVIVPAQ